MYRWLIFLLGLPCLGMLPASVCKAQDSAALSATEATRFTVQPARLEPYERTPVLAKIEGFVMKSRSIRDSYGNDTQKPIADIGDRVSEGEVLAQLWIPEWLEELEQRKALVEQALAQLEQAEAELEVSQLHVLASEARIEETKARVSRTVADVDRWQSEFQRIERLAQSGSVTEKLVTETENQLRSAQSGLQEARAKVETTKAELASTTAAVLKAKADITAARARARVAETEVNRLAAMVEYATVRAPFDGVVTERNVDTGHFVQSGSSSSRPLFIVERIDQLRVVVDIPEREANLVHPGNPAFVSIPSRGEQEVEATVSRTSWTLNPAARTLRVELDLDNSQLRLRPGQFTKVRIALLDSPGI